MKRCLTTIVLICMTQLFVNAYNREMTIYVGPGRLECFYHEMSAGDQMDIEYQVIDGGHGDLDITFTLYDNNKLIIRNDYKKPEGTFRHLVLDNGDYSICFDNTFSSFNRKTVFFELIVEKERAELDESELSAEMVEGVTSKEYYEIKVLDIMAYITRIRTSLNKARQIQDILRSNEARDRNLAEANFLKVNNWSLFQICAMIAVGLLQVFLVRSIFETNTRMSKLWQKLKF